MTAQWKKPKGWQKGDWEPGKPGTPPKSGVTMRDKIIVVCSASDKERIVATAKAAGKSASEWARTILLEHAPEN